MAEFATPSAPGAEAQPVRATPYNPKNITTNADTLVKTGAGVLHGITINNAGTTWVLTLYDGTDASGTKIGTVAASGIGSLLYDVYFATGLFIHSAGGAAGDATVSYL